MVGIAKRLFRFTRWKAAQAWLWLWPNIEVIGIAGSVGKTTTKEIISAVLGEQFDAVRTPKNWDPIFNLPITALKTKPNSKFIAELGVDAVGQMDTYLTLVQPRIGVLTRLTLEHTDKEHFGNLETAIAEEVKLLKALPEYGWAVLNGDDPEIRKAANATNAHTLLYGFAGDDLKIDEFSQQVTETGAESTFRVNFSTGNYRFTTNLLGKHNATAACAGIAVGIISGMSFDTIQQGLAKLTPVPGRLCPVKGLWGLVIDDTYNASPAAVKAAIDTLIDLDPNEGILVLGDMLELGEYAKKAHFNVGNYARQKGVKALAAYGSHASTILKGFGNPAKSFEGQTHTHIVEWLKGIGKGAVLVKGSHSMHMEKVVEALTK